MSAVYSVVFPNSVQVLTDGAIYTREGVLTGAADKAFASPHVPMVCSGRGNFLVVETLCRVIVGLSAVGSFDRTMSLVRGMFANDQGRLAQLPSFELLIAGWSEEYGPCHKLVASHGHYHGLEPFVLRDDMPMDCGLGPEVSVLEMTAAGLSPLRIRAAGEDALRKHGADLMEVLRCKPGLNFDDPESMLHHGIGCHCDLTIVSEHGVEKHRLRTWPDVIGELIDPFSADRMAA